MLMRLFHVAVTGFLLFSAISFSVAPAYADDSAWYDQSPWQRSLDRADVIQQDLYVSVRDGTRIAVTVYLPKDWANQERLPAILRQTRYWRKTLPVAGGTSTIPQEISRAVAHGYAFVYADVRGTGASFGTHRHSWSSDEIADSNDLVDWIIRQPWSSGKVATEGVSYLGATAELALANIHPAVVAAVLQFSFFDFYAETGYPGGVRLAKVLDRWGAFVRALDQNCFSCVAKLTGQQSLGVHPVDGADGRMLLVEAIEGHRTNFDFAAFAAATPYRDTPGRDAFGDRITWDNFSAHAQAHKIARAPVAIFGISGWYDAGLPAASIHRHLRYGNKHNRLLLGPWDHGAGQNISPWAQSRKPSFDLWAEILRFLDFHMKGLDTGISQDAPIYYFTMGEEVWKSAAQWPPSGIASKTYYLHNNQRLCMRAPPHYAGSDRYSVDFTVTTGPNSRWQSVANLANVAIGYDNRHDQQSQLLTYTSPPLAAEMEVTGQPIVTLYLSSSAPDGAVHAYLEDVTPQGTVIYVTEGMLRISHRKVTPSPYPVIGPYHSHRQVDAQPLKAEEIVELSFSMIPTSYLFKPGHSLRLSIAGADADFFERIPARGQPPHLQVARNRAHASSMRLPVMAHPGQIEMRQPDCR